MKRFRLFIVLSLLSSVVAGEIKHEEKKLRPGFDSGKRPYVHLGEVSLSVHEEDVNTLSVNEAHARFVRPIMGCLQKIQSPILSKSTLTDPQVFLISDTNGYLGDRQFGEPRGQFSILFSPGKNSGRASNRLYMFTKERSFAYYGENAPNLFHFDVQNNLEFWRPTSNDLEFEGTKSESYRRKWEFYSNWNRSVVVDFGLTPKRVLTRGYQQVRNSNSMLPTSVKAELSVGQINYQHHTDNPYRRQYKLGESLWTEFGGMITERAGFREGLSQLSSISTRHLGAAMRDILRGPRAQISEVKTALQDCMSSYLSSPDARANIFKSAVQKWLDEIQALSF